MRRGGQSDPRNKALMKMFNLIGVGERAGSGVPELFSVWAHEDWIEPTIEEQFDPDRTILTMQFLKKTARKKARENTLKQYEMILSMMSPEEWYQATDFMDVLQIKERRIQVLLKELLQNGKIIDNGKIKGRKYKRLNLQFIDFSSFMQIFPVCK
ncbi:hypothetical protein HF861_02760 [Faecalicoccus pleomorphus]|uniref:ATP-dependent DNA helicase RecG C-terminal domain-containing protein n=1 Tax=Faecalicoccus pleomorphus TaxID=1323 RepID=A0A7X9NGI0_9FIRM|nr:hypothetical protein [Faecalicoccus pleomorphus]NME43803.1 hypothetical protein [Faecalicoccus pleomorphus]